jgi:hypothetical protein
MFLDNECHIAPPRAAHNRIGLCKGSQCDIVKWTTQELDCSVDPAALMWRGQVSTSCATCFEMCVHDAGVLVAAAPKADAIVIPSQESTGGSRKEGSLPSSTSTASMSAYSMEGIKKRGISPKKRAEVLKELRASAKAGK